MPKQVRIEFPSAVYHVMGRGDRREPIVPTDCKGTMKGAGTITGRDEVMFFVGLRSSATTSSNR
jgi:hypothetical protein